MHKINQINASLVRKGIALENELISYGLQTFAC